ncbi:MAG: asparagine synthase-related protein, partial [Methanococcaceae archaeon]
GQGADELLAGYDYFFGFYFKEILLKFNILKFLNEATHYIAKHHSMYSIGAAGFLLLPSKLQTEYKLKNNMALADDFARLYGSNKRITETLYSSKTLHNSLLDHFEYKLEHLLLWGDRNSMWFSVEVRFPFLDYRLVEKCLALANDQIIKRGITKQILRESMKGVLPEKIRMRKDKVGFETPENEWFREEKFRDLIYNILDQKKFAYRGYIDSMQAKRMYCKHLDRKVNISKMIWKWVNLELWFNKFIDHAEHMEI